MHNECRKSRTDDIIRLLKVYAHVRDLDKTKQLHSHIVELGPDVALQVSSALVHSYIRCGSLQNSCSIFDNVRLRDVILWTTLITGYAQSGLCTEAFMSFKRMHVEGEVPNHFTYASILKVCAGMSDCRMANQVHSSLIEAGFDSDVTIGNVLVDVYSKLGSMEQARLVFNNMRRKDVVSWSAMISCFSQYESWREAVLLFEAMHQEHLQPNNYTYVSVFKACASLKDLETCRRVHSQVFERSLEVDVYVRSTLVDAYVKCGSIEDARQVFDNILEPDLVSMNAMLSGYAQNALGEEALFFFRKLQNAGVMPDKVTFATLLKACASVASIEEGTQVHACISNSGIARDLFMGSTLVDMYVKCKRVDDACKVFDGMFERDVVLWNCLLVAYQEDNGEEAMHLFNQMQHEGVFADAVTFVIMLKVCIGIAALIWGKQAHAHLVNSSLESNIYVRSSLLDMYAKCGNLECARRVFDNTQQRDVVAWNSMITAYAQRGHNKEVFTLFNLMQKEGLEPSGVTLGCVLSACRHTGLVEDGCEYFKSLTVTYHIKPSGEHFGCIVDLFARVGRLDEAADFLSQLPLEPTVEPWMALLGACKVHGNVDVGECAFEHIERIEPGHVGSVILLSNVYAAAKKWDAVNATRLKLGAGAMHEEPEQHINFVFSALNNMHTP